MIVTGKRVERCFLTSMTAFLNHLLYLIYEAFGNTQIFSMNLAFQSQQVQEFIEDVSFELSDSFGFYSLLANNQFHGDRCRKF